MIAATLRRRSARSNQADKERDEEQSEKDQQTFKRKVGHFSENSISYRDQALDRIDLLLFQRRWSNTVWADGKRFRGNPILSKRIKSFVSLATSENEIGHRFRSAGLIFQQLLLEVSKLSQRLSDVFRQKLARFFNFSFEVGTFGPKVFRKYGVDSVQAEIDKAFVI